MYSTNPFLQMLAAIGDDEDLQQPDGSSGGGQQQQQYQNQPRIGRVQLGEFWPQAPNAWFAAADLKFQVANITSERDRFAHAWAPWASTCCELSWTWSRILRRWIPTPR